MITSFYDQAEVQKLGFKSLGKNVLISRFARFYNIKSISIGDNVRIDDFCILSGNINIGSYIHISAYTALYGKGGIEMENYSGLSPRCTLFSASDDFSGSHLIGPMVEELFTNVIEGKIILKKYVQVGSGTIIMPSVVIEEGSVVGAMSLVKKNIPEWCIYSGIPAKFLKNRKKDLLSLL